MESHTDRNPAQGTTKNITWVFFKEHTHPLTKTSSRGSYNSQEFYLDNRFFSKDPFPIENLLRHTWNTHFNHLQILEVSNKFV